MTRGDIVVVAARGVDTGKPRPAVVVQSNSFTPTHDSITLCLITSNAIDTPMFRVSLPSGEQTGLVMGSQVMVDKVVTVPRAAIVGHIGSCDPVHLDAIDNALRGWLSL
jgi:mRNA interferase MazF